MSRSSTDNTLTVWTMFIKFYGYTHNYKCIYLIGSKSPKHYSLFYLEKKWDERSHPLVLFTAQPQSEWMMRGEVWGWHLRPITFQTLYNSSRFCLYTGPTRGDFTIHRNHYLTFSVLAIFSFPCIKIRFEL